MLQIIAAEQCSGHSYVLQITAVKVADCKYGNNGECISFEINHCDLLRVMLGEKLGKISVADFTKLDHCP